MIIIVIIALLYIKFVDFILFESLFHLHVILSLPNVKVRFFSRYSVTSSLGETVVAFDFASPIEYIPKPKLLSNKDPKPIKLQPIYLLQGNGDVLMLLTSLSYNK